MAIYGVETTLTYVAWDTSANAGKTGDASNHTLRWVKDGTAAAPTNSPSEVDATNAPGVYKITLTSSETQAVVGTLTGKSATAKVSIIPVQVAFERLPNAAPGSANGLPILDANGRVSADMTAISGDSTAADNAEAMFDGTGYAGGAVKLAVNTVQIDGSDATDQIRDAVVDDATRLDGSALNTLAGHDPGTTIGTSTLTAADVWGHATRSLTTFGTLASDVATAVWAAGTRTLTSFGTLVSDVTSGVWSAGTRTLTSFGTLASDTATAVWSAGTRTLTSFGTLVTDVWGYSTRSLTTFGTLVSDVTTSVWSAGTRTLTSFGTLANDVANEVWSATTRTVTSLSSVAGDIWSYSTRTLTSIGDFAADIWNYTTRTVSQVTGSVGSIANGGITASSLASSATESIADAIWDEAATGHTDSGKAGAQIWTDIDAILDDTGTSGVAIADNAITSAKIAADAITSSSLSIEALAQIAAAVLSKIIADHKEESGSLADILNDIWRRVGYGAIVTNSDNNTIEVYDAASAEGEPILTQTGSSAGTEITWTPS